MMTENDRKNAIDYARKLGREEGKEEGRAEGIAKGRMEGRAEGEKNGKLSVARKMLAAGLDTKMIAEMTGLPETEIRGL